MHHPILINFISVKRMLVLLTVTLLAVCSYLAPRTRAPGPARVDGGIRFAFYSPTALRVQLAGNWPENNWARGDGSVGEADIGLMTDENHDGVWEIVVALHPGRYQYLFWVDEATWHVDPGNPEQVPTTGPVPMASQLIVVRRGDELEIR